MSWTERISRRTPSIMTTPRRCWRLVKSGADSWISRTAGAGWPARRRSQPNAIGAGLNSTMSMVTERSRMVQAACRPCAKSAPCRLKFTPPSFMLNRPKKDSSCAERSNWPEFWPMANDPRSPPPMPVIGVALAVVSEAGRAISAGRMAHAEVVRAAIAAKAMVRRFMGRRLRGSCCYPYVPGLVCGR